MTQRKQEPHQTPHQRHRLCKKSIMLGWGLLLAFLALCASHHRGAVIVFAKEIEATREWQLVGENDTLPAGLHIRMDLTTGEKWAKLPDDEDNDNNENVMEDMVDAVVVDADGSVSAVAAVPDDSKKDDDINDNGIPDYDYDMMHRTLSQLPPEEQARVGGIPELPHEGSLASLTEHERELVEMRLRQIWEQRQEELRSIEEEHVADLPQILKDRIQSLSDYLKDPAGHFNEASSKQQTADGMASEMTTEDEESLNTIVDVLADLEYLLTDLDMTRDFYTLGGWPLLSSLLSDEVHGDLSSSNNDQWAFVQDVQSTAAWALGTAVKNSGEFAPWTVEPLVVGNQNKTTALDLIQSSLEVSLATAMTTTTSTTTSNTPESRNLQQKLVYALGSFLRGNLHAQVHFADKNGPNFLAKALALLMQDRRGTGACTPTPHCTKMTQRLLSLAADVVLESRQQQEQMRMQRQEQMEDNDEESDRNTKAIADAVDFVVQSFADNASWCDLVLDIWKNQPITPALASAAVHALPIFEPQCRWDSARLSAVLEPVRAHYNSMDGEDEELAILGSILDKEDAKQK